MILQFSGAVEEESGTRRAYKRAGLCEGVRAGVPEEVTLTLGSEKQTRKLAGARKEWKMTYKEVPVTMGPTWMGRRWDQEVWQEKSQVVLKKTGLPPKREESVDGFEQASDLIRCAF